MVALWIEFLDAVVPTVRDINIAISIYCYTLGIMELPMFLSFFPKTPQQSVAIIYLDAVVEIICKDKVALRSKGES